MKNSLKYNAKLISLKKEHFFLENEKTTARYLEAKLV